MASVNDMLVDVIDPVDRRLDQQTAMAPLIKYDVNESALALTKARCADLSADTPQGYEEVRLALAELRGARGVIEKRRVELKADALAFGRAVDAEAKRYTAMIVEIEEPLSQKKHDVDYEKSRIRAEADAAKQAAIEAVIRAEREAEEAALKAVRDAEEARLAEERKGLEAERAALAEARVAQQAERDALEHEHRRMSAEIAEVKLAEANRLAAVERAATMAARAPDFEKVQVFAQAIRTLAMVAPVTGTTDAKAEIADAVAALEKIATALDAFRVG